MRAHDSTAGRPQEGRPPAILQVIPSLVSGGVERGTVDLAGALVAAGWSAYVASAGGPMERELARLGAVHFTLPLASKNPLTIRRNAVALCDIIRRHKIDIVHARSRAPAWSAYWASQTTRRRFVTTFHNAYDATGALKRKYNSVMARGERVIAISQFVADHAEAVYGVGPDRLRVIPRAETVSLGFWARLTARTTYHVALLGGLYWVWFFFLVRFYVGYFFVYDPYLPFLNHPLIQVPCFDFIPVHLYLGRDL